MCHGTIYTCQPYFTLPKLCRNPADIYVWISRVCERARREVALSIGSYTSLGNPFDFATDQRLGRTNW